LDAEAPAFCGLDLPPQTPLLLLRPRMLDAESPLFLDRLGQRAVRLGELALSRSIFVKQLLIPFHASQSPARAGRPAGMSFASARFHICT